VGSDPTKDWTPEQRELYLSSLGITKELFDKLGDMNEAQKEIFWLRQALSSLSKAAETCRKDLISSDEYFDCDLNTMSLVGYAETVVYQTEQFLSKFEARS
jgi:hypothetical protein